MDPPMLNSCLHFHYVQRRTPNVSSWRHHKEVSSWSHLCSNIQHSLWSQLSWWLCKVSDCGHRGRRTAAGSCGVAPSAARRSWWRGRGWRPRLGERESWPLHSSSGIILLHPHTQVRHNWLQWRNIGWCQVCLLTSFNPFSIHCIYR